MTEWMKLIECKHTPNNIFTIHDYTKIAYSIDNHFCLRQIVTPEQKPIFIERSHSTKKIHTISRIPNHLITVQSNEQDYWVYFYNTSENTEKHVKINWSVTDEKIREIRAVCMEDYFVVLGIFQESISANNNNNKNSSSSFSADSIGSWIEELIFISLERKCVVAKGLLEGPTKQMVMGPNNTVSLLSTQNKNISLYKNQAVQSGIGRIYKSYETTLNTLTQKVSPSSLQNQQSSSIVCNKQSQQSHTLKRKNTLNSYYNIFAVQEHFWVENQLVIWGDNRMIIIIDSTIYQQINCFHRLHNAHPLICGFLVCDGCILKIYKKKSVSFEEICEFSDQYLISAQNIVMSPQQDILAYYCPMIQCIVYCKQFSKQIEEENNLSLRDELKGTILRVSLIGHQKHFDYMMYGSQQGWFVAINGSEIKIYGIDNYENFLSFQLQQQTAKQMLSDGIISEPIKVRYLAVHPNRPLLAIALSKSILIYYIAFKQAILLKQINVSMCGYLLFNNSGTILTAIMQGKMGSKILLYKINQIKHQYTLLQTLTVSKKIVKIFWNALDTKLFCFHHNGYVYWQTSNYFKHKRQSLLQLDYIIKGALITKNDSLVVWGNTKIIRIRDLKDDEKIQQDTNNNNNIKNQSKNYLLNKTKGILIQEEVNVDKKKQMIKSIFFIGEMFYFVFEDGRIFKNKNLEIGGGFALSQNFRVKERKKEVMENNDFCSNYERFQVQILNGNKIIYINEDLNVKFYQLTSVITSTSQQPQQACLTKNNFLINIVGVQKKKIINLLQKYSKYEQQIKQLKQNTKRVIFSIKQSAQNIHQQKQLQYKKQLKQLIAREKRMKEQKLKLEQVMDNNIELKQMQAMNQVKDLQKLYERKIALTTNKLLTENEIGYRDKITAENKLKLLEVKHYESIEEIRCEFSEHIKRNCVEKDQINRTITSMKKQYENRLYDLEQENEILLLSYQDRNQGVLSNLKKAANKWEKMYCQCLSEKDNIEKDLKNERIQSEIVREQKEMIEHRKMEGERRCEKLNEEIVKLGAILQDRNKTLQCYERRIVDLQKSNQILKYRVVEFKQQNDPYQQEITQLKSNLTDLEEQHEQILKNFHQNQQKLQVYKKQKVKLKQDSENGVNRYKKLWKRFEDLVEKIREITKYPIQDIRKELLATVDKYSKQQNSKVVLKNRAQSPLGELNRIKDHLEICLDEAVLINKKNEEQKKIQVLKKNQENSELITEINVLRKRIRQLQQQNKQKQVTINRILHGDTPSIGYRTNSINNPTHHKQQRATTQTGSKQFRKTRGRETFYQKSLFTNNRHEKRLKTEQGSRRKKSSMSMVRDRTMHGALAITSGLDEIEQYKRIIEQKDLFIQKLITKLHKT